MGRNCALACSHFQVASSIGQATNRAAYSRRSSSICSKVLRGRRHNSGGDDQSFLIQSVTVIENAARRLSDRLAYAGPVGRLGSRRAWRFVLANDSQSLSAGEDQLDCTHHDAAERILHRRSQPHFQRD